MIEVVCDELVARFWHDEFRVDMIQGGAGTSTIVNMNAVIANLGLIKLGHQPGDYAHLHPYDDVNRSQATNDVYPTAMRLAEAFLGSNRRVLRHQKNRPDAVTGRRSDDALIGVHWVRRDHSRRCRDHGAAETPSFRSEARRYGDRDPGQYAGRICRGGSGGTLSCHRLVAGIGR